MERKIREFHLFAGIGGGIYGGQLLGHKCCGGVEIDEFCQKVLKQRMFDGWINKFDLYGDLCNIHGEKFKGNFDILCGGFPCQAFSTAAHGKNIPTKNLWGEMLRFVKESQAPIVFGENVVFRAIHKAQLDLEEEGYRVKVCRLSCSDLGADHQRNRFWLLAIKEENIFDKIKKKFSKFPKLKGDCWTVNPQKNGCIGKVSNRRQQLKAIGNAQSPFVAATAFRILVNRHIDTKNEYGIHATGAEINRVFEIKRSWIKSIFGLKFGLVHTPTTMANYSAPSMQHHKGCKNFVKVFQKPTPDNAEYLMGFPIGASSLYQVNKKNLDEWRGA